MNYKIIFGVGIPVVLSLILIFLVSSNIGFSVSQKNSEFLVANVTSLSPSYYSVSSSTPLIILDLENNFFLPRNYKIGSYLICLLDSDNEIVSGTDKINWHFSVFDTSDKNYPAFEPVKNKEFVEVPAYSNRRVLLFADDLTIAYNKLAKYSNSTSATLVKSSKFYCNKLSQEELNNGIHFSFEVI